jgi:iron complex outermembrane receptor protein
MEDSHLYKQNLLSLVAVLSIAAVDVAYAEVQIVTNSESESSQVEADTTQAKKAKKKSDDEALETMVVTATRSEIAASMAPSNVSVISAETTENRLVQRLGDALKDIPGVYLRGGAYGTHFPGSSTSFSSFHGVGGANRSLYMVDGLPVNTPNNGNVDWNILNMDDAQQVEYVPGPFSALYGSGAMGGVVNVISKVPTKREGKLTFGAGGAAVDQWGIKGRYRDRFENGLSISLTFNHMDSDNWAVSDYVTINRGGSALNASSIPVLGAIATTNNTGQTQQFIIGDKGRRPWEQNNASLHLYYDLTSHTQIDGGMGWSRGETNDSGSYNSYLTKLDGTPISIGSGSSNLNINGRRYAVTESPFMHFLPGIEDTRRYFAHLKHDFGNDVKLNVDFQYLQTETFSTSPGSNATLTGGSGTLTQTPSNRIDGNVSLRFPFLWEQRNFVTVGFGSSKTSLEGQSRYNLGNWRNSDLNTTLPALSKGESSIYSAYVQDELWLRQNLIAHLGLRYDDWSTSGSNFNSSPAFNKNYQDHGVGQFNPKFSLTWLPADGYKLFASTGWAFRPPTNFELYGSTISASSLTEPNPNLSPETMYSWEVGGEAKPLEGTSIAASYYHHYISDLIYNKTLAVIGNQTQAEKQNAGSAEVEGIEVKLKQRLYWDWLHFNGSYTLNDSIITKNSANQAIVGKQMQQLPKTMFSGGLDIKWDKWAGGIIGRYVGQASFNDLNTDSVTGRPGSYDPYFLIDTRIAYQATKNIDLSFSVNNLLDREYSVFYQQAGRTVYGEVSYSF